MTATLEEMAREADMSEQYATFAGEKLWLASDSDLARFAALVRAQARAEALEDAARACVALSVPVRPADDYDMPPGPYQCAAAIRALP